MFGQESGRGALATGGLAAVLASTCYLGPLILITLGFSGTWIGYLTVLEPYRFLFTSVAIIALFFTYQHIWHPTSICKPGEVCIIPQVKMTYKVLFLVVAHLVLIALVFPYVAPLFY